MFLGVENSSPTLEVCFVLLICSLFTEKLVCVQGRGGYQHPSPTHPHRGQRFESDRGIICAAGGTHPESSTGAAGYRQDPQDRANKVRLGCLYQWKEIWLSCITNSSIYEASYVLLVKPILDPAQELQAIGRIHLIHQTMKGLVVLDNLNQRCHSHQMHTCSELLL